MRTLCHAVGVLTAICLTPAALAADETDEVPSEPTPSDEAPALETSTPDDTPAAPMAASPEVTLELEQLREQIADLQARIGEQHTDITRTKRNLEARDEFKVEMEGLFRTRGYVFGKLFADQDRDARYMDMRLRLRPTFNYKDLAKAKFQVDALEDVVWGDNNDVANTAVFADAPSNTHVSGRSPPSIRLTRAWIEAVVPVGLVRVGRQPSQWGMGLLANDGNGLEKWFGEKHEGATFDRAIFATRPLALVQKIAGKKDSNTPLFLAIGVDRLVEDPLTQYYGYKCRQGMTQGEDDAYDVRCDPDEDGYSDLDHGYTEERDADTRGGDWWANQNDDVAQLVVAMIYKGTDLPLLGSSDSLTAGLYFVHRWQKETDSQVLISDLFVDAKLKSWRFEFEGTHIGGHSSGIALPGAFDPSGELDNPLYKDVAIDSYVGRAGYYRPDYELIMEHGFASGDDNVADSRFTGRPIHQDHNVGLLLYEEIIARATAEQWGDGADSLWSRGGVYNSRYIYPHARYTPLDNIDLIGGFVMAWPHKPDGSIVLCKAGEGCDQSPATAGSLGWEIDLGTKIHWHDHLHFSLEFGYAHATDRLPLVAAGLDPSGNFMTVQSRMAYTF
ncbi:MAG: hypothetical protein ACI9MC_002435 [Kiritimatiellia bacterium]|jgi:hypothetical protein